MARQPASDPTTKHPSQLLALVIGVVYTLVGIAGFFVTGFENFAAETNKTLLGFEINPLHNLVHLAIGLAGLTLWRRLDTAKTYGWLLAAGYGLAFLYGLFAAGNSDITKEKAGRWTPWRAFTQVRHSSNFQLLPFSLVTSCPSTAPTMACI